MTSHESSRKISSETSRLPNPADWSDGSATVPAPGSSLRVMTYNVHGFVGVDRVYDPERTARVIEACHADVVALQEVDFGRGPRAEGSVIEKLARRLGMRCHFTRTREGKGGSFGNAVLSSHAFELVAEGTLPRRRDEARAVQWLKIVSPRLQLHLMNTHLSVRWAERRAQVHALLGAEWAVQAGSDLPLIVCGDLNASPYSSVYRRLARDLRDAQCGSSRRGTWPSRLPFWCIDHIFVSPSLRVVACVVMREGLARSASDHLPLLAELALPA
jgi:endonuclease/exonuclease/phosphatase family metal-dependent hydrolase